MYLGAHEVCSHIVCGLTPLCGIIQLQVTAAERQQEDLLMQQAPPPPGALLPGHPGPLTGLKAGHFQSSLA